MTYQIHITKTAERDLAGAADYIEYTLKNPSAADNLLDKAEEKISALSDFPQIHAIVDDPVLSAWGIRFTVINNYLAFLPFSMIPSISFVSFMENATGSAS